MEFDIRPFCDHDKAGCMTAFKSNVPHFFLDHEISLFEDFLDGFHTQITNGKYFEKTYYYVTESANQIVGCGGFGYNDKTNSVTLAWGMVHKDFQKQGFGRKLLEYRLKQISILYPAAMVIIDTTQFSLPFFEKFGFVTTKVTDDFYGIGMHRYDMILKN